MIVSLLDINKKNPKPEIMESMNNLYKEHRVISLYTEIYLIIFNMDVFVFLHFKSQEETALYYHSFNQLQGKHKPLYQQ